MNTRRTITFLQVEIGRGHPFYLDGIADEVTRLGVSLSPRFVDACSQRAGMPGVVWPALRRLYHYGSSGGVIGPLYSWLRRHSGTGSTIPGWALIGRELRKNLLKSNEPVIVSHPILVSALAGHHGLIYQHGELVAPRMSLVAGATRVLVPTEEVADEFVKAGYPRERLFISGLCIEPGLVAMAEKAYLDRIERWRQGEVLSGIFVSSGAEPGPHVREIISSITSCIQGGRRAFVLARAGGRLEHRLRSVLGSEKVLPVKVAEGVSLPAEFPACVLLSYRTRQEEAALTAAVFPQVDFVVGPPHERTNWAVGLGLPMFVLTPTFGPFAPLNLRLSEEAGVARVIRSRFDAARLGETVGALRDSGELAQMAERGRGRHPIDGFSRIASSLEHLV